MKNIDGDPLNSKKVAQKLTIFSSVSKENQVKYKGVKFKNTLSTKKCTSSILRYLYLAPEKNYPIKLGSDIQKN